MAARVEKERRGGSEGAAARVVRPRFGHPRPRSPSHGGEGGQAAKGEGGSANERKGREAAARIR